MSNRITPPATRTSITRRVELGKFVIYLIVGFYENMQPCEVFITLAKTGSTLRGFADAVAIGLSFSLQHGATWESLARKFENTSYEPSSEHFSSFMDMVAKSVSAMISDFGGNPTEDHKYSLTKETDNESQD